MATFLFDSVVFGPVFSRRLGISLGINLLPDDAKICNFDCIYCECGWTQREKMQKVTFHSRSEVYKALENKLIDIKQKGEKIDTITFAGNGEPTIHPDFQNIINDTIELKNKHFAEGKIAVLSNATMLHKKSVFESLLKVDFNILKIDSAHQKTIQLIDNPIGNYSLNKVIKNIKRFESNVIIQTMFVRGMYKEQIVDNTTDEEVSAWINVLNDIRPKMVMIYTIARDTPTSGWQKISKNELEAIAQKVKLMNIEVQISA